MDEICLIGTPKQVVEKAHRRYDGLADTLILYAVSDGGDHTDKGKITLEENLLRAMDAFKHY